MSKSAPVRSRTSAGYEEDFYAWALGSAALLREKRFSNIDTTRLAEEIEDMGKRERRALERQVRNLILHLLKWTYEPLQAQSVVATIYTQRAHRDPQDPSRQPEPDRIRGRDRGRRVARGPRRRH